MTSQIAYFTGYQSTDIFELSDEFYIAHFFNVNFDDATQCHNHKVDSQQALLIENRDSVYTHECELPDVKLASYEYAEKLWYEMFPDFKEFEDEYSTNSFDAGLEFEEDVIDDFMEALIERGFNGAYTIDRVTDLPVIAYFDMQSVIVKQAVIVTDM